MNKDLAVVAKAKELSALIFEISETSPKKFRFSLVSRMQNLSLEIISNLYSANETDVHMKLVRDMEKSINHIKSMKGFKSEEEKIYYKDKLFRLKIMRALKLDERLSKRIDYSVSAMTKLKELDWLVTLSGEVQCITNKQREKLAAMIYEERRLIGGFIKSDKKRFGL